MLLREKMNFNLFTTEILKLYIYCIYENMFKNHTAEIKMVKNISKKFDGNKVNISVNWNIQFTPAIHFLPQYQQAL